MSACAYCHALSWYSVYTIYTLNVIDLYMQLCYMKLELLMDGVLDCMIPSVYSGHDCMIKPTATIDYYTMRIIETHDDESDETYNGTSRTGVTFLYQLIHGKCLQSLGVHCAQVAGLPKSVIDRGKQ